MAARPLTITLADGSAITVQPTLEDRLKFETTLRKNPSWGALKDNALKLEPFLAWSAASRTAQTTLSWAEFTSGPTAVLDVAAADDDVDQDADLEVEGLGKDTPTTATPISPSSSVTSSAAPLGYGAESLPRH